MAEKFPNLKKTHIKIPWLWGRLAATAPIQPLAWEPPYATGVAQEMAKRQKIK